MLNFLRARLTKLLQDLEIHTSTMDGAKEIGDYELAERAQALSEETVSQLWECRKQIENNNKKGLYFIERTEPTT